MERGKRSKMYNLNLSYQDYLNSGRTIANTRIDKYIVYDELGRGAFGAVYLGMDDQTKNKVAIKVLDLHAIQKEPNDRVREIKRRLSQTQSQLMMICDSDNVVKCYNVYENRSLKIMVMEYCNGGELQREISTKYKIPEREAILILKQIINGIAELHNHNIIHRDLKAQNILSHNGVYKIADLGFSKQVAADQLKQTTLGTITTMAPEVMRKESYGLKADIWSIGVIFFQMIFGKLPYNSTNATLLYHEIQTKKLFNTECFEFNGHKASKNVTDFLRQVLTIDKQKRLGWKQMIKHPLFYDQHDRLSNEFRLNIEIRQPKIQLDEKLQNDRFENQEQQYLQKPLEEISDETKQVIRMTQAEVGKKRNEIKHKQDEVYEWVKQTHLECLKTELIFTKIFMVIETNKLLDMQARDAVQFMYLLLTRCLNNISVINDKMQNEKQHDRLLKKLQENVKTLYDMITKAWNRYAGYLTKFQNKVTSIISDRLMKMFKAKSIQTKDKFLTGIQKIEYTKEEQIKFTDSEYIEDVRKALRQDPVSASKKVNNYLLHYAEINMIKRVDLKNRSFEQYVEMILQ